MSKHLLFGALAFVFVACKSNKKEMTSTLKPSDQAPVSVGVMVIKSAVVSEMLEVNGSVMANENVNINPETAGRLTFLNVNDGLSVSQGTILAKINDADLQAQLKKLRVQIALSEKTEERLRKLLAVGGINQADYDVVLSQLQNLKADTEIIQANIAKTIIRAPFSGVLGLRKISPGAYVTPQTVITTLLQTNKVKVDFSVPEQYANLMQKGKTIKLEGLNKKLNATIIATEPEINEATRNLKVRAVLNEGSLTVGSFVKILIEQSNVNKENIVIPTNCIIPEAKNKKVIIVKNGKGSFVNVETGLRTADGIQITKGLQIGDSLVITGVLFVRPNSVLKVKDVK